MRNMKKMTQVAYVQNVKMIIDLLALCESAANSHLVHALMFFFLEKTITCAMTCRWPVYMRNVKKVTQLAYVQAVMMIINLNADFCFSTHPPQQPMKTLARVAS